MKKQLAIVAALLLAGGIASSVVPGFAQDASSSAMTSEMSSFDCMSASSDLSMMSSDSSFISEYSEYCPSDSSSTAM